MATYKVGAVGRLVEDRVPQATQTLTVSLSSLRADLVGTMVWSNLKYPINTQLVQKTLLISFHDFLSIVCIFIFAEIDWKV